MPTATAKYHRRRFKIKLKPLSSGSNSTSEPPPVQNQNRSYLPRSGSYRNKLTVHGKQFGVSPSQDSYMLFLGNVCKTWAKEALKERLKRYGVDTVEDLTLVEDSKNDGTNRGVAFLEFFFTFRCNGCFQTSSKEGCYFWF